MDIKQNLTEADNEVLRKYGDIIDLPRPVSKKHMPMPAEKRCAQFSPFAALEGYEETVTQAREQYNEERELKGEHRREYIDPC